MGWPYFTEELWLATPDNGLAASMYAASSVTAKVGNGTSVTITEDTTYPFSEQITFTVRTPAGRSSTSPTCSPSPTTHWCSASGGSATWRNSPAEPPGRRVRVSAGSPVRVRWRGGQCCPGRCRRYRPGRLLHVIGASEMAEPLRHLYGSGGVTCWTLQPMRETRTPLHNVQQAIRWRHWSRLHPARDGEGRSLRCRFEDEAHCEMLFHKICRTGRYTRMSSC
jgi:hypothetical protein